MLAAYYQKDNESNGPDSESFSVRCEFSSPNKKTSDKSCCTDEQVPILPDKAIDVVEINSELIESLQK